MLGFLSKIVDPKQKVTHDEIYFVSVPDGLSDEEIKANISSKAKLFANKFNLQEVFLHFGKVTIKYEYKV